VLVLLLLLLLLVVSTCACMGTGSLICAHTYPIKHTRDNKSCFRHG
jgi:hypothetical protein